MLFWFGILSQFLAVILNPVLCEVLFGLPFKLLSFLPSAVLETTWEDGIETETKMIKRKKLIIWCCGLRLFSCSFSLQEVRREGNRLVLPLVFAPLAPLPPPPPQLLSFQSVWKWGRWERGASMLGFAGRPEGMGRNWAFPLNCVIYK